MSFLKSANRLKHLAGIAAGALGVTGERPIVGPLYAQIGICDPCNHECAFCQDHAPTERQSAWTQNRFGGLQPGVMSFEHFKRIVNDLYGAGTRVLELVGRGEPLLNRAAVDIVGYAKEKGMLVSLCSNGSPLSKEKAEGMVSAGLDWFNVSLNAGTPENYPNNHVTETPENYLKVKRNLHYLSDCRAASGSNKPCIQLSCVVSNKNYFEIEHLIRVAHEVGADQCQLMHIVVHDGTNDMALNREQHKGLLENIPRIRALAAELGVKTNLAEFAATVPAYFQEEIVGPQVVPCYVGYYFTVVLGNGSVMPCCQCTTPVGQVTEKASFRDVWRSEKYRTFRRAARNLPDRSEVLRGCECDRCELRHRNVSLHNVLHPLAKIDVGDDELFTPTGVLRRLIKAGRFLS